MNADSLLFITILIPLINHMVFFANRCLKKKHIIKMCFAVQMKYLTGIAQTCGNSGNTDHQSVIDRGMFSRIFRQIATTTFHQFGL